MPGQGPDDALLDAFAPRPDASAPRPARQHGFADQTEGGYPDPEQLFGDDWLTSAEIASAALEQLVSDAPGPFGSPGYRSAWADHRRRGYPDTSALREVMDI